MALIEVESVSKFFRRNTGRKLLRDQILDIFRAPRQEDIFYALRNVSFTVTEGESVALVGSNGAGKSTALSLITGLAKPDEGRVTVRGRVAAMLQLGSGFHPDLTGEENTYLNAALLGFSEQRLKERFASILDFAEIGDFIREPIRTYSSGMTLRLAFAIAIHVDPKILIVDEVLGVGDAHFGQKCLQKINEMRRQGITMLCVSHNQATVLSLCDRAIWLNHGQMMLDGPAPEVLQAYSMFTADPDKYMNASTESTPIITSAAGV